MDKYCRLCLKEDQAKCFFPFSNILNDYSSVFECYTILTSIIFEDPEDRDNSKICKECWMKLYSYSEFRGLAITSNDFINGLKAQGKLHKLPNFFLT